MDFYLTDNAESSSLYQRGTGGPKTRVQVTALTLDQIVRAVPSSTVALGKFDTECAEIEVLMGASETTLQRFEQISVEFHDFTLPEVSTEDVERAKRRLHERGFYSVSFSRKNTDVLFINKRAGLLTKWQARWLLHVVRNSRGAARLARRWLRPRAGWFWRQCFTRD